MHASSQAKCGFVNSPRIPVITQLPADHPLKHQSTYYTIPTSYYSASSKAPWGRSQAASPHRDSRGKACYSFYSRTATSQLISSHHPPLPPVFSPVVFTGPDVSTLLQDLSDLEICLSIPRLAISCTGRLDLFVGLSADSIIHLGIPGWLFQHGQYPSF